MSGDAFIFTCDKGVRDKLRTLGFQEISSPNVDFFIFINDSKILFTNEIDMSKIKYSNKLFF